VEEMNKSEQLIACLEGEIAKRDGELAACRVAVENCELFRARIAELEAKYLELASLSSLISVELPIAYALPVSEAKAQGVVMPEREEFEDAYSAEYGTPVSVLKLLREGENYIEKPQHSDRLNSSWWMWQKACARLNATHVQQVSVPASAFASRAITHYEAALLAAFPSGSSGEVFNQWNEARRVLAAAPAAPAADAWIPVSERIPAVESRLDQECRVGTLSIAPLNVSAAVLVFDGEKVRSTRLEWFDGCLPLPYCITHWMPLPAAPAAHRSTGVISNDQ